MAVYRNRACIRFPHTLIEGSECFRFRNRPAPILPRYETSQRAKTASSSIDPRGREAATERGPTLNCSMNRASTRCLSFSSTVEDALLTGPQLRTAATTYNAGAGKQRPLVTKGNGSSMRRNSGLRPSSAYQTDNKLIVDGNSGHMKDVSRSLKALFDPNHAKSCGRDRLYVDPLADGSCDRENRNPGSQRCVCKPMTPECVERYKNSEACRISISPGVIWR
jgi:hypothetical protein